MEVGEKLAWAEGEGERVGERGRGKEREGGRGRGRSPHVLRVPLVKNAGWRLLLAKPGRLNTSIYLHCSLKF